MLWRRFHFVASQAECSAIVDVQGHFGFDMEDDFCRLPMLIALVIYRSKNKTKTYRGNGFHRSSFVGCQSVAPGKVDLSKSEILCYAERRDEGECTR